MVQRLGLITFLCWAQVQSLVGELRSCKPCGATRKKKPKKCEQNLPPPRIAGPLFLHLITQV